eukprot:SAG11_NODE_29548_length_309_cov_2.066667_1_plen_72_part_10
MSLRNCDSQNAKYLPSTKLKPYRVLPTVRRRKVQKVPGKSVTHPRSGHLVGSYKTDTALPGYKLGETGDPGT